MLCEVCGRFFRSEKNLVKHLKIHDVHAGNIECTHCGKLFESKKQIKKHLIRLKCACGKFKKKCTTPAECKEKIKIQCFCRICSNFYDKNKQRQHLQSDLHRNSGKKYNDNILLFESALASKVRHFVYESSHAETKKVDVEKYLQECMPQLEKLLKEQLHELRSIKFRLVLNVLFYKPTEQGDEAKEDGDDDVMNLGESFRFFYSSFHAVLFSDVVEEGGLRKIVQDSNDEVYDSYENYYGLNSGWSILEIVSLNILIIKIEAFGRKFISAGSLESKKSLLNIRNNDEFCLLYCVVAYFHRDKFKYKKKALQYKQFFKNFNYKKDLVWPLHLKNIKQFEEMNDFKFAINVYQRVDVDKHIYGVLRISQIADRAQHSIDVLLLEDEKSGSFHYALITNLLRLVRGGKTKHNGEMFLCKRCLCTFKSKKSFEFHNFIKCTQIAKVFNVEKPFVKFERISTMNRHIMAVYSDIECLLKAPLSNCVTSTQRTASKTKNVHEHFPIMIGYKIVTTIADEIPLKIFTGIDCISQYFDSLFEDVSAFFEAYVFVPASKPTPMSPQIEKILNDVKICFVCGQDLHDGGQIVIDHNHLLVTQDLIDKNNCFPRALLNSNIRGKLHSKCNILLRDMNEVYIYHHYGMFYDNAILIDYLTRNNLGAINVIPRTHNKFLAFTLKTQIKTKSYMFRFHDSYCHLDSSLASVSEALELKETREFFKTSLGEDIDHKRVSKIPFWYESLNSFECLENKEFPEMQAFKSSIKEDISIEDYNFSKYIYVKLKCKNWGEYLRFYLHLDILILSEIFESWRTFTLVNYGIDCLYYVSLPSFSLNAYLKFHAKKVGLIVDPSIHEMVANSIRGGICYSTKFNCKANNEYLRNFNPEEEKSYLLFLDVVSLYSHTMSSYNFPLDDFQLITDEARLDFLKDSILNLSENAGVGYFFLCDIHIPEHLHDALDDYHPCPQLYKMKGKKVNKLIVNLYDKNLYFTHYLHLKICIQAGMIIKKMHAAVSFSQSMHLSNFIKFNINLRSNPNLTVFERGLFKKICNSLYGKTLESKITHRNYKLITNFSSENRARKALKYFNLPSLKNVTIFREDLVGVEMHKTNVTCNVLIALGKTCLDLSKMIMFQRILAMKTIFGPETRFISGDTDSLLLLIKHNSPYEIIKKNMQFFDGTSFNKFCDIPTINYKKSGALCCEVDGRCIEEFIYKSPKCYYIKSYYHGDIQDFEKKRAKGISRHVAKRFSIFDYKNNKPFFVKLHLIRAIGFRLFTIEQQKIALARKCDKRYFVNDDTSYSWGHYKIADIEPPFEIESSSFDAYLKQINEKRKLCVVRKIN